MTISCFNSVMCYESNDYNLVIFIFPYDTNCFTELYFISVLHDSFHFVMYPYIVMLATIACAVSIVDRSGDMQSKTLWA